MPEALDTGRMHFVVKNSIAYIPEAVSLGNSMHEQRKRGHLACEANLGVGNPQRPLPACHKRSSSLAAFQAHCKHTPEHFDGIEITHVAQVKTPGR